MRVLLLALALSAAAVSAEDAHTPCADCMVLNPAQVEAMKRDFGEMLRKAFEDGKASQKEACISLVKG